MKKYEDKNIKNKVLAVLAVVFCLLMICFWTGKDENAVSTEDVKAAEDVSQKETEVLAHNAALKTIDGRDVQMRDLYNKKPVYVFFWMLWSEDSKKQLSVMEPIYKTYGKDVYFVIVSLGSTEKEAQRFYKKSSYTMPFYTSGLAMASDYNVYEVPQSIMIARGGTIKKRHIGTLPEKELAYFIVKNMK